VGGWALVALVLVVYAVAARRLDRLSITAPIVLVVAGTVLGAGYLAVLPANVSTESVRLVTELTLALILFADASTVEFRQAERDAGLPLRLLGVGLPLTIALGALVARLVFPSISWSEAALIGAILAPTDAALGVAVVTNSMVPLRIRRALNIESGLNDGIATPFVTVFLAIVVAGVAHEHWAVDAVAELARGALIGVGVGYLGGRLVRWAKSAEWSSPFSDQLVVLSLASLSYAAAVNYSGNGFVAAFVAGLVFGAASRGQLRVATEFTDTVGLFSSFVVWVIFGASFVGPVLRSGVHLRPVLYAVLSLTVVRMIPVAIALIGGRLRPVTVAFIGWFGPRGLASVVFTVIAFDALGGQQLARGLVEITTWTILLSVLAHGLSSGPFAAAYGRLLKVAPAGTPELATGEPTRVRRRSLF
jgi:NhaP-type Na+/H+ or K+/H+ antiporter